MARNHNFSTFSTFFVSDILSENFIYIDTHYGIPFFCQKRMGYNRDGDVKMIPVLVAVGVVVAGLAITSTYVVLEVQKKNKNRDDMDFNCPECGASVDGIAEVCPECNAEFKEGEFECPVCGSAVSADTKLCMVCNERFEEEEIFVCPHCGAPTSPDTMVCEKCDEEFWSPVIPANVTEVEAITTTEESEESASEAVSP